MQYLLSSVKSIEPSLRPNRRPRSSSAQQGAIMSVGCVRERLAVLDDHLHLNALVRKVVAVLRTADDQPNGQAMLARVRAEGTSERSVAESVGKGGWCVGVWGGWWWWWGTSTLSSMQWAWKASLSASSSPQSRHLIRFTRFCFARRAASALCARAISSPAASQSVPT